MTGSKLIDLGVTKVWWVTTVVSPTAITVAEITAGKDISTALLPDYSFGADASTTVTERDITALFDADTPTIGKYKGSLHLFRKILNTGLAGTDDLLSTFAGKPRGYLVRRIGLPSTTAIAALQVVDIGEFIADVPQQEAGTGSGFVKLTVPLLPQGYYYPNVSVVA